MKKTDRKPTRKLLAERADLATAVYDYVYAETPSFEDCDVGADLAYLLGAILKGGGFGETPSGGDGLLVLLRRDRALWRRVRRAVEIVEVPR